MHTVIGAIVKNIPVALILTVSVLLSQPCPAADSASRATPKVIVISRDATFGVARKPSGKAPFGEILTVEKVQKDFAWIREYGAWMRGEDLKQIDALLRDTTARIKMKPEADDYFLRGKSREFLGKQAEALADFNAAIELAPESAAPYEGRGSLRYRQGEAVDAADDLERALTLDPEHLLALATRSMLRADKGDLEGAMDDLNLVLKLSPGDPNTLNNRGVLYREMQDYDRAIADYTRTIQLVPSHARAYANRAYCWNKQRDFQQAVADYARAVELNSESWQALNDFAWLLATCSSAEFRDGRKALTLATKACELTANKEWSALDTLAAAYAECGEFKKAVECSEKAIELAPEETRAESRQMRENFAAGKPHREE